MATETVSCVTADGFQVTTDLQADAVVIFGSGRSGTTWVQDTLAEANHYATVFEPLHPDDVPGAERFANRYIPPGVENAELRAFMHSVLHERVAPVWTRMRVRRDRLLPRTEDDTFIRAIRNLRVTYARLFRRWLDDRRLRDRPRIVKMIRGNLLAEWLVAEFGVPGAVVVRHPCAVLASVMRRSGQEWSISALRTVLERYLAQPDIVSGLLAGHVAPLTALSTYSGVHTAIWCIENAAFVGDDRTRGLHISHYEHLVCDSGSAWSLLTSALHLDRVPDEQLRMKPSQQAGYPLLRQFSTERLLSGWEDKLDAGQKDEVARVLDLFGVTAYTVGDPMPTTARISEPGEPGLHSAGR